MNETSLETTHGTVKLPQDGIAWRAVQIRRSPVEIEAALRKAYLPGEAFFLEAPGDRGTTLSVELNSEQEPDAEHFLSPFEGASIAERLESALRAFKARLETGEVATTDGQPSGREP